MIHNTRLIQPRKGEHTIFRKINSGYVNVFFLAITDILFRLSHYPSYIVEVFLRKNMGQRYFTSSIAILLSILMLGVYFLMGEMSSFLGFTWPIFCLVFLWKSIQRRREIKKFGTTYNFDRFSYSDGEKLPFLENLIGQEFYGFKINRYRMLIFIEPALPIIAGLFLMIIPFTRGVGMLLFVSGVLFGFRSFLKVHKARAHVLDIIDAQIASEAKRKVLVEDKPIKGISFPYDLPEDEDVREDISDATDNPFDIWDDDEQ